MQKQYLPSTALLDYPDYSAHFSSVLRRLHFEATLSIREEYSPKFQFIQITLVGPEPVPTFPNLVIQCCYQDSFVVTRAVHEHFLEKR